MWLSMLAGSKIVRLVGVALVVGLILFSTIQYIRGAEEDRIKLKLIEKEIATEEEINNAISNSPNDPDSILEWLQRRNR